MVTSGRRRDNVHKLKCRRLSMNIRNHFDTVRMTEHWPRSLREVVESASVETFKTWLDTVLGDLL